MVEVSVGGRYVSGSMSDEGISEVSLSPMVEKCRFNSSAISRCSVIVCSAILVFEIFPTLFECRKESSLIKCHVFLGFDQLSSRLSIKYLRLAFLISLFIWFRAGLYSVHVDCLRSYMAFFFESRLCISRRRLSVIHKAFLLPTRLDLSGVCLSMDCISISFHMDHISFGSSFVLGPLGSQTDGNFSCVGFLLF